MLKSKKAFTFVCFWRKKKIKKMHFTNRSVWLGLISTHLLSHCFTGSLIVPAENNDRCIMSEILIAHVWACFRRIDLPWQLRLQKPSPKKSSFFYSLCPLLLPNSVIWDIFVKWARFLCSFKILVKHMAVSRLYSISDEFPHKSNISGFYGSYCLI